MKVTLTVLLGLLSLASIFDPFIRIFAVTTRWWQQSASQTLWTLGAKYQSTSKWHCLSYFLYEAQSTYTSDWCPSLLNWDINNPALVTWCHQIPDPAAILTTCPRTSRLYPDLLDWLSPRTLRQPCLRFQSEHTVPCNIFNTAETTWTIHNHNDSTHMLTFCVWLTQ